MDRRSLIGQGAAIATLSLLAPASLAAAARRTQGRLIIDGLASPFLRDIYPATPFEPPIVTERARTIIAESGVTGFNVTLGDGGNAAKIYDMFLDEMATWEWIIDGQPALFRQVRYASDIEEAKRSGRIGIIFGTQDTQNFAGQEDRFMRAVVAGAKIMGLTYNLDNLHGSGALEPGDGGITIAGRKMIEQIEGAKVLLDLSHGGARTIDEALAAAKRPPSISHTGCRALNDNVRNVSDAAIRACADKGGVTGIYLMPFLVADSHPKTEDVIRHLDHAVKVAGEDHVAIGRDGGIEDIDTSPQGYADHKKAYERRVEMGVAAPGETADALYTVMGYDKHDRLVRLADDLSRHGWKSNRIDKVMGQNWLRLYRDVWGS